MTYRFLQFELDEEAHDLREGDAARHYALGCWHSVNGKHEFAIARCETAIEMNPNSASAVLLAALVRLGRREEAEEAKHRLLERRPELTMSMVRQLYSGQYRPVAEVPSKVGLPNIDPARKAVPSSPKRRSTPSPGLP